MTKDKKKLFRETEGQKEIWKDIEGYEGLYKVSNLGNIKSLDRTDCSGRKIKGKIIKQSQNRGGYKYIKLHKNSEIKNVSVHRLVAVAFVENIHEKKCVNHIDGNKHNNNSNNLEWVTQSENIKHAYDNELIMKKYGEKHHLYGKKHTDEARAKMSENHADFKGDKHPMYGVDRSGPKSPMFGKKHTDETRKKISKSRLEKGIGRGNKNPNARKIICLNTGEVFSYIGEASKKYEIPSSRISRCCSKELKSAGKIKNERAIWMYYEEYLDIKDEAGVENNEKK